MWKSVRSLLQCKPTRIVTRHKEKESDVFIRLWGFLCLASDCLAIFGIRTAWYQIVLSASWWIFISWLCLIAFQTHSQLCPPNLMLQGIMKKHLFPFFAESAGVKHKARYSQRASKPTGYTWVHGTRQEAPKGPVELFGVIVRSLSVIFERSWQLGEDPGDWKICPCRYSKLRGLDRMICRNPFLRLGFCNCVPVQRCDWESLSAFQDTS